MQTLAAYLFKAGIDSAKVNSRTNVVEDEISAWLKHKGAEEPTAPLGSFVSQTGDGQGRFVRGLVKSQLGTIETTSLVEIARTGQTFTTNIQVIREEASVTFFSTMSAANERNVIAPLSLYPKCPHVVRKLLNTYGDWTFCGQKLPRGKVIDARGEADAIRLCQELVNPARNFPTIVISVDDDERVWEQLPDQLARDMIGLAHVATVDEAASWAMTDELGKADSCYLGAVRLYWPKGDAKARGLKGSVWTPARLRTLGTDNAGMKRFQSLLRGTVMSAAALAITPPACIREIQAAAIAESINKAKKAAVEKELDSIIEENSRLCEQLNEANSKLSELEWKVESFRHRLRQQENERNDDVFDGIDSNVAGDPPPEKGETIYYKKIGTGGGVDTLVRTGPCNHREGAWTPAFRGDQAEKGLLRLEGRNDWQSIQHCGSCTGGGRWRVRW